MPDVVVNTGILPFLTTHPCPEPQKSLMLIGEGIDLTQIYLLRWTTNYNFSATSWLKPTKNVWLQLLHIVIWTNKLAANLIKNYIFYQSVTDKGNRKTQ